MNEELMNRVADNAAYIEDSTFEFDGFDIEFHGKTEGLNSDSCHIAPRDENGKAHFGKVTARFNGFVSKEGWTQLIRAVVEITLAELKSAPELVKPLFGLVVEMCRAHFELKRMDREIRLRELEAEAAREPKSTKKAEVKK